MKHWHYLVLSATLCLGSAALATAQDAPPKMTAEEEKAMAEMMRLATPGVHHEHLKMMEGTWKVKSSMWSAPGTAPQTSEGTSTNRFVLGGRFLLQEFKGSYMDQPFEGLGITGYDNAKEKYIGTWSDTMGTMIMMSEGKCDGAGKKYEFTAMAYDPMQKKDVKFREVIEVQSPTKHTFSMFMAGPDGKEFKNLEIVYEKQ